GVPGSGILPVKVDSVIGNSLQFVDNNLPVNSTGYYYADILNGNIHIVTSPVWYTRICSIANDITVSACSNYTWNGTTYTASTTASATFRTDGGCDSTVTLHLTIKQPTTGDTTAVACDRFTWYGNTYTSSATATHVFTNAAGCDSTVTLHLTINTSPSVAITAAGPTSVCPGSGVNLTTEADAGSGSIDTYQWLLKGNPLTGGLPSFTATSTGNYSVKITNSNSCFAVSNAISVTVEDHVLPVPNVAELPDVTGECSATATTPAATDNCAGIITGTTTDPLSYNSQGTHTITWIFDDHNGNVTTQNQRVIVHDATAPVITVPVAINKNTDPGVCNAVVNFSATATDNCNGPVTINYSQAPGTAFPEGVTTIVVTAKDENGNSSSSGFTITITDNQPPLVTAIPVVNTCNSTSGTYTIPAATATDNCGMDSVSYVITGATSRSGSGYNASGGFNTGTSTIVWTVTDIHGNISTASTTVNVNAALNASIVVNPVYTVAPGGSAYTIYLGYGPQTVSLKATATGGTAPYTYTWNTVSSLSSFNTASTNASPVTTTTYTVTITDAAGCQASITQTIQVVDVRSGNKNDKVTICHSGHEISVSSNAVPAQLKNGGYLGNCTINNSARGNSPAPVNSMNKLSIRVDEKTSSSLNVSVKPNPSISVFMVHVETSSPDPVTIRITDESGRLREMKKNITGRNDVMIGGNLKGGTYFIEVEQGTKKQTVKVIKLN
ncbi:MAG: hypothetical protein JWN76_3320, partial [Chitinophagaceae bacterium]|nr:hypothetical protein [Chitinophagaceae bacterium]